MSYMKGYKSPMIIWTLKQNLGRRIPIASAALIILIAILAQACEKNQNRSPSSEVSLDVEVSDEEVSAPRVASGVPSGTDPAHQTCLFQELPKNFASS